MDSFSITLVSNNKGFERNELNDFTTLLPQPIRLDCSWKVALSEVHYPKSFFPIDKGGAYILVGTDDYEVRQKFPDVVKELRNKPSSRKRRSTRFTPAPDPEADVEFRKQESEVATLAAVTKDQQIQLLTQQLVEARQKLQTATGRVTLLESHAANVAQEKKDLREQKIAKETEIENLNKLLKEKQDAETSIEERESALRSRIAQYDKAVAEHDTSKTLHESDRQKLVDDLAKLGREKTTLSSNLLKLESDRTTLETARTKLESDLKELLKRQTRADEMLAKARTRERNAAMIESDHRTKLEELEERQRVLNEKEAELNRNRNEIERIRSNLNSNVTSTMTIVENNDLQRRAEELALKETEQLRLKAELDASLLDLTRKQEALVRQEQLLKEQQKLAESQIPADIPNVSEADIEKQHDELLIEVATREMNLFQKQREVKELESQSHNKRITHQKEITLKREELANQENDLKNKELELKELEALLEHMKNEQSEKPEESIPSTVELLEPPLDLEGDDPDLYKYMFVVKVTGEGEKEFEFEGGEFSTVSELAEHLNEFYSNEVNVTKNSPLSFKQVRNNIQIRPRYPFFDSDARMLALPYFSEDLRLSIGMPAYDSIEMLNFYKEWRRGKHSLLTFGPVDLKAGYSNMFIYTDIVRPRIVGDTRANVLRTVGIPKADFGENISVEFKRLDFLDLSLLEFDKIRITFNYDDGRPVPFKFGRTIVQLIFKRE